MQNIDFLEKKVWRDNLRVHGIVLYSKISKFGVTLRNESVSEALDVRVGCSKEN